jgi:hypothetical protein
MIGLSPLAQCDARPGPSRAGNNAGHFPIIWSIAPAQSPRITQDHHRSGFNIELTVFNLELLGAICTQQADVSDVAIDLQPCDAVSPMDQDVAVLANC